MSKIKIVIIAINFLVLIFVVSRCEFKPDDLPLTEVNPPQETGPPIAMTLNNLIDTIKIGWKTDFSYSILGTPNKIYSVVLTFEGKLLHNYIGEYGQTTIFSFDPADYNNGKYYLKIVILTSSGTGSIADKVGAEGYVYEHNWPVIIDKTLPERSPDLQIKATKIPEGINLSWRSFNHPNFISYQIFRHYPVFQQAPVPIAIINDPGITSVIDSTYWEGEHAMYYLQINTPAGSRQGDYIYFYDQLTGLKATWHTDGSTYVTWDKARNLESFSKYYVYCGWDFSKIEEKYFITNPDENFVTLKNTGFGSGLYIFLKFIPKGVQENQYNNLAYSYKELIPPPTIPVFQSSFSVNNHDFLLLADWKKIYRFYPYESRTEDSVSVNLDTYWMISVSYNGNKFAYYQDDKIFVRRTADFYLEKEFPGPQLKSLNRTLEGLSFADDGKLIAIDNAGYVYLYDSFNGSLLRKDSMDVRGVKLALISPEGSGMVAQTTTSSVSLHTLNQEGWKEIARTDIIPYMIFYSLDGKSVYIASDSELQKRNSGDLSLISGYLLPGGYIRSVDIDHERFFMSYKAAPGNLLVELNTGKILDTIPGLISDCRPFNNYLITSGRQLILPEF